MMRYGNDDDFVRKFTHDNVVRKTFEKESFGPLVARRAGQSGERKDFVFEEIERGIDRVIGFQAQPRALFLMPGRRFDGLLGGLFEDAYPAH